MKHSSQDGGTVEQRSALAELVDSCLDLKWHLDPVEATEAGLSQHDHRLGAFGVADIKHALAALKSISAALESVPVESLDDEIDRTALLNDLRITVHRFEHERPHERNPIFWVSHVLNGLYLLLVIRDRPHDHRCRAAAERIRSLPRFLEYARDTLGPVPRVFADTAIEIAGAGMMLLQQAKQEMQPAGDESFDIACSEGADALAAFSQHLQSLGEGEDEGGFAIGEGAFNFRLNYEHALQATATELARYGVALVEATERELRDLASQIDGSILWPDLVDRLRDEYPPPEQLVMTYASEMERSRSFVASNDVVPVPPGALEVVETPEFLRPMIPFAAYQPPGAFSEDRTGLFYVTDPGKGELQSSERLMRDHCVHELACTALHEGYPGHHLQFLNAQAHPSLVRKVIGSPIAIEGWALYCEEMMGELGFYRTLEEVFFQKLALLWRAARVVIDVGLHTQGMPLEEAVSLLTDRLHFDKLSAEAEVRRYCAHPAYQLCYAVGLREIQSLRKDFQEAAGSGYADRDFHNAVLSYGGLPVSLMRWGMGLGD
jgi:uncharacterized protein (DUF885 family)